MFQCPAPFTCTFPILFTSRIALHTIVVLVKGPLAVWCAPGGVYNLHLLSTCTDQVNHISTLQFYVMAYPRVDSPGLSYGVFFFCTVIKNIFYIGFQTNTYVEMSCDSKFIIGIV